MRAIQRHLPTDRRLGVAGTECAQIKASESAEVAG